MPLYTNHTRFPAIVTVKITVVADTDAALKIGTKDVKDDHPGDAGYHDVLVNPEMMLELSEGTTAEFVTVRAAD